MVLLMDLWVYLLVTVKVLYLSSKFFGENWSQIRAIPLELFMMLLMDLVVNLLVQLYLFVTVKMLYLSSKLFG